jgi:hypothetical protein
MLSWVFRNRARLELIYGVVAPPRLAGERFANSGPAALPAPRDRELRPGEFRGRGARLVIRPMARRVG